MVWSDSFWDKCSDIDKYYELKGDYMEVLLMFVKEQTKIHESYTKKLQKSLKNFNEAVKKKKCEQIENSSFYKFNETINSDLSSYIGCYTLFNENINRTIVELSKRNQEINKQKAKVFSDMMKVSKGYNSHLSAVNSDLKSLTHKKNEICNLKEQRLSLNSEDAKKHKQLGNELSDKNKSFSKQKNNYDKETKKLQILSIQYYQSVLPESLDSVERLDNERTEVAHNALKAFLLYLCDTQPKALDYLKMLEQSCTDDIDLNKDANDFILNYQTSEQRPMEVDIVPIELEFEDNQYSMIDSAQLKLDRTSSFNSLDNNILNYNMASVPANQRAEEAKRKINEIDVYLSDLLSKKNSTEDALMTGDKSSETKKLLLKVNSTITKCQAAIIDLEQYTLDYKETVMIYESPDDIIMEFNNGNEDSFAYAKFNFDAQEPTEMSACENEKLVIITPDDGSGWTLVAKSDNVDCQGFFPSSYLREA